METEMKQIVEKKIYEDGKKEYASKGMAGTALGFGIGGAAIGVAALLGGRGGAGGKSPENVNINMGGSPGTGGMGGPTAFQSWVRGCDDAIELTNTIWGLKVNTMEQMYTHRETDVAEKFGLWKSQADSDFALYKSQRDLYDVLNERYAEKFNSLDKKVAVLEATRPYQDKLILCEIEKAYTASVNYTDRKTCRAIYGVVGLPSEPTVTVLEGANNCRSASVAA